MDFINQLPPEILIEILMEEAALWIDVNRQSLFWNPPRIRNELLRLSTVCSLWREILAPKIWERIKWTNAGEGLLEMASVVTQKYGQYVKDQSLTFDPFIEADSVTNTLDGIKQIFKYTPETTSLTIQFIVHGGDGFLFYNQRTPENDKRTAEEMTKYYDLPQHSSWPGLDCLWQAMPILAKVQVLKIQSLPRVDSGVFQAEAWMAFIQKVHKLSIGFDETWRHKDGRYLTTTDRQEVARYFDEAFFKHAANLKSLSLDWRPHDNFDRSERLWKPLVVKPERLPELKELELSGFVLCNDLTQFLTSRARDLDVVNLKYVTGDENNSFQALFSRIAAANPVMRSFKCSPTNYDTLEELPDTIYAFDEWLEIRDEFNNNDDRPLFLYEDAVVVPNDPWRVSLEQVMSNFHLGADSREYCKLQRMVAGNHESWSG